MTAEQSELADRLTTEIDELRVMKNSNAYRLFLADIRETRQGLIEMLIKTDPANASKMGRTQGGILAFGDLLGLGDTGSFIDQIIEARQSDIDDLRARK